MRVAVAAVTVLAGLTPASPAAAQDMQQQPDTQLPAAWVGKPGEITGLLDFRGFYQHTSGDRTSWSGAELLSYFDLAQGFSGAFVMRHEARDQVSDYGTLMLIPQLTDRLWLVGSAGVGNGADFQPITRLDLQIRGFFDRPKRDIMYDVGGYATWWSQGRRQVANSNAIIFWRQPWIVELRETAMLTDSNTGFLRLNMRATAIVLYGSDNHYWWVFRAAVGDEPENVVGLDVAMARDLLVGLASVAHRRWITDRYGVAAEVEAFGQVHTWWRMGFVVSAFADF